MSTAIAIRAASQADAPAVSAVYLAARHTFLSYAPLAHSDDAIRDWITQTLLHAGGVYVALASGQIVGMMGLADRGAARWIDHLYVSPPWVNQGIGTALLQMALRTCKPPIHLYTFQANTGARRFYERHGFRALVYGDGTGNEERIPDVLYAWDGT